MAVVRGQRVDLLSLVIEREGEELPVCDPESTAATGFTSPLAMPSKTELSTRTMQSACAFLCDTAISPLSIATCQRFVCLPFVRSKRSEAFTFSSRGS